MNVLLYLHVFNVQDSQEFRKLFLSLLDNAFKKQVIPAAAGTQLLLLFIDYMRCDIHKCGVFLMVVITTTVTPKITTIKPFYTCTYHISLMLCALWAIAVHKLMHYALLP